MKTGSLIRKIVPMMFLLCVVMSVNIMPVKAYFSDSDTPPLSDDGRDPTVDFACCASDATYGKCRIEVTYLDWPWFYAAQTEDYAWVGCAYEMPESQTYNWYLNADWDLDYELGARYDCEIHIEVWYVLRDSSGDLLQEKLAWDDEFAQSGSSWGFTGDTVSEDITKTFTYDLEDGVWYKFCVELRVWLYYAGRDYQCHADTDSGSPALLEVNEIHWYD